MQDIKKLKEKIVDYFYNLSDEKKLKSDLDYLAIDLYEIDENESVYKVVSEVLEYESEEEIKRIAEALNLI